MLCTKTSFEIKSRLFRWGCSGPGDVSLPLVDGDAESDGLASQARGVLAVLYRLLLLILVPKLHKAVAPEGASTALSF